MPDDLQVGSDFSRHPIPGQLSLAASGRMPGEVNVFEPSRCTGTYYTSCGLMHTEPCPIHD